MIRHSPEALITVDEGAGSRSSMHLSIAVLPMHQLDATNSNVITHVVESF